MKAWKAAEYKAAKTLRGKRNILSGGGSHRPQGDVELPAWFVEVKYRQLWHVFTLFLNVERKAKKEGTNALLILTEKNTHGQLAVMRIEDFEKLPKVLHVANAAPTPAPSVDRPRRGRPRKGG